MDLTPAEIEILTTWADYVDGEWGFGDGPDHDPRPEADLYARLRAEQHEHEWVRGATSPRYGGGTYTRWTCALGCGRTAYTDGDETPGSTA